MEAVPAMTNKYARAEELFRLWVDELQWDTDAFSAGLRDERFTCSRDVPVCYSSPISDLPHVFNWANTMSMTPDEIERPDGKNAARKLFKSILENWYAALDVIAYVGWRHSRAESRGLLNIPGIPTVSDVSILVEHAGAHSCNAFVLPQVAHDSMPNSLRRELESSGVRISPISRTYAGSSPVNHGTLYRSEPDAIELTAYIPRPSMVTYADAWDVWKAYWVGQIHGLNIKRPETILYVNLD